MNFLYKTSFYKILKNKLDNKIPREEFVRKQLSLIGEGASILDAGCGTQQYKKYCNHLNYKSQDLGEYSEEEPNIISSSISEHYNKGVYEITNLDYTGNIWNIDEVDEKFDCILCTEVLEHIPYPNETITELSRLLKPGGKLILTMPSNCLRHFDPFFFYSGFSDNWIKKILEDNNFFIDILDPVGDYYSWMNAEIARTSMSQGILAKAMLLPAFVYYFFKKPTSISKASLCFGYHVVATKSH